MPTTDLENLPQSNSSGANGVPSGQESDVSFLDALILFAGRKWYILKFALAVALVAAVISLLLPKRYTAMTVILPPQQAGSTGALMSQLGSLGSLASLMGRDLGIKNPNDMYVSMLKSETVEDAIVRRFNLVDLYRVKLISDARTTLEKRCKIESNTKDGLIRISVEDSEPKRAADMANAFVDEFRSLSAKLAITEASQRRLFFEQQLVDAKNNLADAEEALKRTQLTTGLIQLDSQARATIETVANLRGQIAAREVQIRAMRSFATDENPDLMLAQQQLAAWRAQLARMGGGMSGASDDLLLPKGQVPQAGLEYVRKYRDMKYRETIFELLAKQFEIAKLDEARQGTITQVVDPALRPERRSFPKRTLIVLISGLFGFFLALFRVLVDAHLQDRPDDWHRVQLLKKLLFKRKTVAP